MALISPSILSADFSRLREQVKMIEGAGADIIHIDVMDGRFVPEISFGPVILRSLREKTGLPFDVHLMVERPWLYVEQFIWAGADSITFHLETEHSIHMPQAIDEACRGTMIKRLAQGIRGFYPSTNVKIGVAINPRTPFEKLKVFLELGVIDLFLIMGVEPGFAGQKFMPKVLPTIKKLRKIIDKDKLSHCKISVDGGIHANEPENTARQAREAGADILVAGSAIFGAKNPKQVIRKMKKL